MEELVKALHKGFENNSTKTIEICRDYQKRTNFVKVNSKDDVIDVKSLSPTQSEIDLSKSQDIISKADNKDIPRYLNCNKGGVENEITVNDLPLITIN